MTSKPPASIPFITCHVAVYASNRTTCFYADKDYRCYLEQLGKLCKLHGIALHAYTLLPNHIHLIATPSDRYAIHCLIQDINKVFQNYLQQEYRHSGRLWQEQYHLSPLQEGNFLLDCYRYIELNPVRAGIVSHPGNYSWSSYRCHGYGSENELITLHGSYMALGDSDRERQCAWRKFLDRKPDTFDMYQLKRALFYSRPVGDEKFTAEMASVVKHNNWLPLQTSKTGTHNTA